MPPATARTQLQRHIEDTLVLFTTEFGRMPTFQAGASGLDHERLRDFHEGQERRLTDVHGRVLRDILA